MGARTRQEGMPYTGGKTLLQRKCRPGSMPPLPRSPHADPAYLTLVPFLTMAGPGAEQLFLAKRIERLCLARLSNGLYVEP